jgi:hypothetical protein
LKSRATGNEEFGRLSSPGGERSLTPKKIKNGKRNQWLCKATV